MATTPQIPDDTGLVRVMVSMVREDGTRVPRAIRTPQDASRYADELRGSDRECFAVILIDVKNRALGLHVASVGTVDASLVSPTIVFRPALLANAVAVIAIHNHPSGDPTPSAEDVRITRQLVDAGKVMQVKLLDHIILGQGDTVFSMREEGLVSFAA